MGDEDMIATIARDVLTGLEYLHDNDSMHRWVCFLGINVAASSVHMKFMCYDQHEGSEPVPWHAAHLHCRDLKAANLLVSDEGRILLADFGACATLEREGRAYGLHSALRHAMQAGSSSGTEKLDFMSPRSCRCPQNVLIIFLGCKVQCKRAHADFQTAGHSLGSDAKA